MRTVIYDIETTGLDIEGGDRIIEIAGVEVVDRQLTGRTFHTLINNEGRAVNPEIYTKNIHTITVEMLADKPLFKEIIGDFLEFCRDSEAVAHNGKGFDEKFLNHEIERVRHPEKFWEAVSKTIDSLEVAKRVRPGKQNSLDKLIDHYEMTEGKEARATQGHNALLDSQLLAEVYLKMTEGLDLNGPSLEEDVARAPVQFIVANANAKPLTVRTADDAEMAAHESYLDVLAKEIKGEPLERKLAVARSSAPRM